MNIIDAAAKKIIIKTANKFIKNVLKKYVIKNCNIVTSSHF